ncbi:MAG TPA: PD-(D/E)XK nuclease family protein, partial [Mesorhizobium sp.]|nr:PD-(D/E)XK nuclease family protein [Mesorhizobium sp.]
KRAPVETTWHALVSRALVGAPEAAEIPHPVTGEPVHRFRVSGLEPLADEAGPEAARPDFGPPPESLFHSLAQVEELPRPLSPSGAAALVEEAMEPVTDMRSPVLDAGAEPAFAIRRGLALHKLLQMLPDIAAAERDAAAARYLARAGAAWPQCGRQAALRAVAAILADARFAPLFAPGSRAEVSVVGSLDIRGRARTVSGKIDRLAVTADSVLIVDYKTNRPAPAALAAVPDAYLLQLALYRALLRPLYPGREVSAALLFTEAPRLIELPAHLLDAALARLGAA